MEKNRVARFFAFNKLLKGAQFLLVVGLLILPIAGHAQITTIVSYDFNGGDQGWQNGVTYSTRGSWVRGQ